MKILFFLVAIANVALLMWEYKTGAFVPVTETSEQNADSVQEQILLVSEIKNIPHVITPAPVSKQPVTDIASTNAIDKSALVPELSTVISENRDKPALEKSTALEMNFNDLIKIPPVITPEPAVVPNDETVNPASEPEPLPALSEGIDKPKLEKSAAANSNVSNADKNAGACYEVGPFANQKAYQALVSRLKDIKSDIKPVNRDDQVASNYMVYYPAAENALESVANIMMLKDHGIKDLWLLTSENKGKISLGLFNKEESALVMKNDLLAKGINVEVKAKYKTKSQKYALIKGDDQLRKRLDNLKNTYPGLLIKPITDDSQGCL